MESLNNENFNYKKQQENLRNVSLEDLEISIRTYQALKNNGIKTLEDILSNPLDFYSNENIPGFNDKSKKEIIDIVNQKKLKFKN